MLNNLIQMMNMQMMSMQGLMSGRNYFARM